MPGEGDLDSSCDILLNEDDEVIILYEHIYIVYSREINLRSIY